MSLQQFFYDSQTKRFIIQFIRVFSHFQVQFGTEQGGDVSLMEVPVKWGTPSRMAQSIIQSNSENKILSVPLISCYLTGFDYAKDRVQDPTYVDKRHIRTRKFNDVTGEYTNTQHKAFTVERIMPVPYTLTFNVDIWTSNTEQKLQLLEQIAPLFNPILEIQSTDNYLDWTSLSYIELQNTNYSSRSVPIGTDEPIDVATFTFSVPIWISPPAKVKKLGVINKIVSSIYDETGSIKDNIIDQDILLGTRSKFTPLNNNIIVLGNNIELLDKNVTVTANDIELPVNTGTNHTTWQSLVDNYGTLQNGISQMRFDTGISEITGTISYNPGDPSRLIFNLDADSIPTNTLEPVDKIINPLHSIPGRDLPSESSGQRYLILQPIGDINNIDGADAWKGTDNSDLIAKANDVIEYDGVKWFVAFSSSTSNIDYITNTNTGTQYKWFNNKWVKSWEGEYKAGDWSLVI